MQENADVKLVHWVYRRLYRAFGKQHWWPAKTPFEVIVGAILTQGTAWSNVEKSVRALREKKALVPERLYSMKSNVLSKTIRSSGFFNVKTRRLRNFVSYLFDRWDGDLHKMFQTPAPFFRREFLTISGLGKETVDSILLYAGNRPIFVVDAYTRRIFSRHGLLRGDEKYDEIQNYFMESLLPESRLFNEYHALLVEVGKRYCRTSPLCQECPLDPLPRSRRISHPFLKKVLEKNR